MENKDKVKLVRLAPLSLRKYIGEEEGEALLQWSVRMGYPRITVYTDNNISKDGKMDFNKVITAPFDYTNLKLFLEYFKEIIDGEDDNKYTLECYNVKFKDGVKTNDTFLQAKVTVGKDKNGIIYLAVIEEEKRKIKFEVLPNPKWYKYYDKEGKEITDLRKLSSLYAKGYVCLVETAIQKEFNIDVKSEVMIDAPNGKKNVVKPPKPNVGSELDDLL